MQLADDAVTLAKAAADLIAAIDAGGAGSTQLIKATSAPTTRADGNALQAQDIWADTDDNNQIYKQTDNISYREDSHFYQR